MHRTMTEVRAAIEARRQRLAAEPFLRSLEASSSVEDLRAFVPHLYFWVFAFQDMLRLAAERVHDPELRELARRHREEDAGHEQWFATDAEELGCARDVVWVFGADHQTTRDVSYELVAEILHATDDRLRLVFPLALEAMGSVFFPRVVAMLERAGFRGRLRYFARSHQHIEESHDIFTGESNKALDSITLEPVVYDQAIALVERCFAHGERLAAHLESHRAAAGSRG